MSQSTKRRRVLKSLVEYDAAVSFNEITFPLLQLGISQLLMSMMKTAILTISQDKEVGLRGNEY